MNKEKVTTYVHIAVAKSYDGHSGFKTGTLTNDDYDSYPFVGIMTDYSTEDPTVPELYSWSLVNEHLLTDAEMDKYRQERRERMNRGVLVANDPVGDSGVVGPKGTPGRNSTEEEARAWGYQLGYTGGCLSQPHMEDKSPTGLAFVYGFREGEKDLLKEEEDFWNE